MPTDRSTYRNLYRSPFVALGLFLISGLAAVYFHFSSKNKIVSEPTTASDESVPGFVSRSTASPDANPALTYGVSTEPVDMTPEELSAIWAKRRELAGAYLDKKYSRKRRAEPLALGVPKSRGKNFEFEGTYFPKVSFQREYREQYESP